MPTTLSAALKDMEEHAEGGKALWNYGQTELDLESHSCIVSKQKYSFSSVLGLIDAMQRTSGILQTTSNNYFPNAILFDHKPRIS